MDVGYEEMERGKRKVEKTRRRKRTAILEQQEGVGQDVKERNKG